MVKLIAEGGVAGHLAHLYDNRGLTFEKLAENIYNTWALSSVNDVESREQCWLSLRLLERLRLHLTSIVETGEMAEKLKEYHI